MAEPGIQGALWSILLVCLLGSTMEFELQENEWDELRSDVADLHRLKGLPDQMTHRSIQTKIIHDSSDISSHGTRKKRFSNYRSDFEKKPMALLDGLKRCHNFTACVLQMDPAFDRFLNEIDGQKIQDVLLSASEISYTYSKRLLIMLDKEKYTHQRAQKEYTIDPHNSVIISDVCIHNDSCLPMLNSADVVKIFGTASEDGHTLSGFTGSSLAHLMLQPALRAASVFSLENNNTSEFHNDFMIVFKSHDSNAVLQTIDPDGLRTYQIMDHTYSAVEYHAPGRPIDHTTQYDNQQIIILEDDPIVREAAKFLYEKHPTVTSVYFIESKNLKLIKGDPVPLSGDSRLVLVGHGVQDTAGEMRLGGYTAKDVAEIIGLTQRTSDHIKTTSVVACEVGSDKVFQKTLLTELYARSIQTELHLRSSLVQISHTGEKLTVEITPNGLETRHKDDSKKVVATLDRDDNVVTREIPNNRRDAIFSNERNFLGRNWWEKYRTTMPDPDNPKKFVAEYAREGKKYIDNLEALTWAFFFPEKNQIKYEKPRKVKDLNNAEYFIPSISNHEKSDTIMYEIKNGKDVLNVINHQATIGEEKDTYLMLHDWIYKVDPKDLYVSLAGKKLHVTQNDKNTQVNTLVEEHKEKKQYKQMQENIKNTDREGYAAYVKDIFHGKSVHLEMKKETWFGKHFLASVISESARNFRTFPLVLMALDMSQSKDDNVRNKGLQFLLEHHPMARADTWVDPSSRGFYGSVTDKGSSKLSNKYYPKSPEDLQFYLKRLTEQENYVFTEWMNWKKINELKIVETFFNIVGFTIRKGSFKGAYNNFLNNVRRPNNNEATGLLSGAHDGSVTLKDLHSAWEVENSLKFNSYYTRSSNIIANQIHSKFKRKNSDRNEELDVIPKTAKLEDGNFKCLLTSKKNPLETIEFKVPLHPEGQLYTEKIMKIMQTVHDPEIVEGTHPHQVSEHLERTGMAVGKVGLMLGMQGAVHAFEEGDIEHGTVATLQTVHGVTGMTLSAIGKSVSQNVEKNAMKTMVKLLKSPVTKRALMAMPVIGIGFGVYNIIEDTKRNDTLGYIDAALDITMVALDILEFIPVLTPFIMPVNIALSAIRMVSDYVSLGIQTELNKLPPNAGILEKILACFVGFNIGLSHLILDVASLIITIPYQAIEEGRRLVQQISDHNKYYNFKEIQKGRKAIDFTAGEDSWNGGNITFCLSDQGPSEFCMDHFVSSDESIGKKCWKINTHETKDIVLGIGESHGLTYENIDIKIFLFIKIYSISVVSGYEALSDTRFGNYWGNNAANNFFAVQNANNRHSIEVMLSYYYRLYGQNGDDVFYLGPQRSYVEGCGGKDTYIIPASGGNTIINNYDPFKLPDFLLLSVNYRQISVSKSGNDIILYYLGSHNIRIMNWFLGDEFRHMNMMSEDGVLFEISTTVISSVQLTAKGINMMSKPHGQTVNASQPLLQSVTNIMGSPFNDILIGNKQNNVINGGGGQDIMRGGEGEDIYIINKRNLSNIFIKNLSHDNETDTLMIEANFHDFKTKVDGNNLKLIPFADQSTDVILVDWFRSEAHRHLLVVTKDLVTFSLSENKATCSQRNPFRSKCLKSQILDYRTSREALNVDLQEDEALESVIEVQGSDFDDVIKGNEQRNTLVPGKGTDFLQGRGGEDWYFVTPGQGLKTIDNISPDLATDILFLREKYILIKYKCNGQNVYLSINGSDEVLLKGWFYSKNSQHLQIKSADGITFQLASNTSSCYHTVKLPQSVDFRNEVAGKSMLMNSMEFASVVEMYGSSGYDNMVGNNQDNMLDPFTGGARMVGGEGNDVYIVKTGYGTNIIIDNIAKDEKVDTLLLEMDFLCGGQLTVQSDREDVLLSTSTQEHKMQIRLLNYNSGQQHQHLSFQSSDGVHFWVRSPVGNKASVLQKPWIEAYKVTMKGKRGGCHIDLSSQSNLSSIHTVQGCPHDSNYITGNEQENALSGGLKDDVLDGGAGHDTMMGGQGNDILIGSIGDDTLYGEEGNDTMIGGWGSDNFIPGPGADLVDGGPGRDTVLYQGDHLKGEGVYVNLLSGECRQADAEGDVLKDVENVIGTIYSDILVSGYEPALLKGSDGNDILVSLVGGDYLIGGEGSDIYMMVNHHGSIIIDNCAADNATDVLYLRSLMANSVKCSHPHDGVFLTFYGLDDTTVNIEVKNWVNDSHECGHLMLVLREGETSVDKLLQECEIRYNREKVIETFTILLLLAIVHGFILVMPVVFKKRKVGQKERQCDRSTNEEEETNEAREEEPEEEVE